MTAWGAFVVVILVLVAEFFMVALGVAVGMWLNRNQHRYPLATPAPPQLYDQDDDEPVRSDTPPDPPPSERKPMIGLE